MENQSKPNDLLVSLCWYTERYKEVLFFSVVILFLDSLFGVAVFRRVHPHHVDAVSYTHLTLPTNSRV